MLALASMTISGCARRALELADIRAYAGVGRGKRSMAARLRGR